MKTKTTKLQANRWGDKLFTSSAHLVELYKNKVIDRVSIGRVEGMHWWRERFNYLTHDGRLIASIEHNSDFGPCTQPYGIELKIASLKSDEKREIQHKVWMTDFMILQGKFAMRRLAKGQTVQQYYYKNN